jgi:hypothetical protein
MFTAGADVFVRRADVVEIGIEAEDAGGRAA